MVEVVKFVIKIDGYFLIIVIDNSFFFCEIIYK